MVWVLDDIWLVYSLFSCAEEYCEIKQASVSCEEHSQFFAYQRFSSWQPRGKFSLFVHSVVLRAPGPVYIIPFSHENGMEIFSYENVIM